MAIASTPALDTNASPPQLADALAVQDPEDIGALFNAQIVSSEDVALVPNDPRTTPSLVSDGEEDPLDFQDPPGCIHGVAEAPCAIMNVQRQCGSRAPIDIDLAKNYTFHRVRLSTIGGNCTSRPGVRHVPSPPLTQRLREHDAQLPAEKGLEQHGPDTDPRKSRRRVLEYYKPGQLQAVVGALGGMRDRRGDDCGIREDRGEAARVFAYLGDVPLRTAAFQGKR